MKRILLSAFGITSVCVVSCSSPKREPTVTVKPESQQVKDDDTSLDSTINALNKKIDDFSSALNKKDKELSDSSALVTQKQKEIDDLKSKGNMTDKTTMEKLNTLQKEKDDLEADKKKLEEEKNKLANDLKTAQTTMTTTKANTNTTVSATAAGYYFLKISGTAKCVDVPNSSTADNIQLISYPCNAAGLNQQFYYTKFVDGTFSLRSRVSGRCVTANLANANVTQKTCTNTTDQSWEALSAAPAKFRNKYTQKCIAYTATGTLITVDCNTIYPLSFTWTTTI